MRAACTVVLVTVFLVLVLVRCWLTEALVPAAGQGESGSSHPPRRSGGSRAHRSGPARPAVPPGAPRAAGRATPSQASRRAFSPARRAARYPRAARADRRGG